MRIYKDKKAAEQNSAIIKISKYVVFSKSLSNGNSKIRNKIDRIVEIEPEVKSCNRANEKNTNKKIETNNTIGFVFFSKRAE